MDDTGFGLLNSRLVAAVQQQWEKSSVGVLFVRLSGRSDAGNRMSRLIAECLPSVIFRFEMDGDWYFITGLAQESGEAGAQLERLAAEIPVRLDSAMEDGLKAYTAGCSLMVPPERAEETERAIYRALRSAFVQALRQHIDLKEDSGHAVPYKPAGDEQFEIGRLAAPIPVFQASQRVDEVNHFFHVHHHEQAVVIVSGTRPVGLMMKEKLHQLLSGPYGLALYSSRECSRIMDASPLVVDAGLSVEQVAQQAMERDTAKMYDVVIITDNEGERLLGAVSIRSLLEHITALRTEAARAASPLTGLPGNETIQAKLQARLSKQEPFSIIYADIDYFKWYNDCFGFAQGDGLIRYLARTLQAKCLELGERGDFVGHVGGDDFIIVTETKEPQRLCEGIIREFDEGVRSFYEDAEITPVQDRQGRLIEQDGVSLSLALLVYEGGRFHSTDRISRLSAALKKRAKSVKGSSYVMDVLQ